jgi:hypothetical protein
MKSLRLRFFIISWPIVVLAVLLVAVGVERWATVELNVIERSEIKAAARAVNRPGVTVWRPRGPRSVRRQVKP